MTKYIVKDHMGREIGTAEEESDFGAEAAGNIGGALAVFFMPFILFAIFAGIAVALAPLCVGYLTLQLVFKGWSSWSRKKKVGYFLLLLASVPVGFYWYGVYLADRSPTNQYPAWWLATWATVWAHMWAVIEPAGRALIKFLNTLETK
jgi:hypothetical protein